MTTVKQGLQDATARLLAIARETIPDLKASQNYAGERQTLPYVQTYLSGVTPAYDGSGYQTFTYAVQVVISVGKITEGIDGDLQTKAFWTWTPELIQAFIEGGSLKTNDEYPAFLDAQGSGFTAMTVRVQDATLQLVFNWQLVFRTSYQQGL